MSVFPLNFSFLLWKLGSYHFSYLLDRILIRTDELGIRKCLQDVKCCYSLIQMNLFVTFISLRIHPRPFALISENELLEGNLFLYP